jgi:hypothetical protein
MGSFGRKGTPSAATTQSSILREEAEKIAAGLSAKNNPAPRCEQEEGVEIISRSEDGFEAIIRSRPKNHFRIQ